MAIDTARSGAAARDNSAYRGVNLILGIWLFISAFVWPHTGAQRTNTWIMGVIITVVSLIAMSTPRARFVNTLAAIWLFISAFALRGENVGTVWNNVIVAVIVFFVSLAPSFSDMSMQRRVPTQPV